MLTRAAPRHAARMLQNSSQKANSGMMRRWMTSRPPGSNPLEVMRQTAEKRLLCDHKGVRCAGQHWSFQIAMNRCNHNSKSEEEKHIQMAPSLRTVNFQRLTSHGIDFVTKPPPPPQSNSTSLYESPVSVVYTCGQYKPGEKVQQWRGEGWCIPANLSEIMPIVPHYTLVGLLASQRATQSGMLLDKHAKEDSDVEYRTEVTNHSKYIELVQKTRVDLENGNVSEEELRSCMRACRFVPDRLELLSASPDLVSLDRWEWMREKYAGEGAPKESAEELVWSAATHLMPF